MPESREDRAEARRLRNIKMPKLITVASDNDLTNPTYIQLLAVVWWCIQVGTKYASRRTIPDIVSDVLRDYEGKFQRADGTPFVINDVDDLLGWPHFDWLRYLFGAALDFDQWTPQAGKLDRLRALSRIPLAVPQM